MKERPIPFTGEMVRAIIDGRKTQTRRIVKIGTLRDRVQSVPGYTPTHNMEVQIHNQWIPESFLIAVEKGSADMNDCEYHSVIGCCPYGHPGDRLWVRETFHRYSIKPIGLQIETNIAYRADTESEQYYAIRWIPSIHMPRSASRINLDITGIRVERVQDISEEDAEREGVYMCGNPEVCTGGEFRHSFQILWDSINLKRGYGWDANPMVWVIEFGREK